MRICATYLDVLRLNTHLMTLLRNIYEPACMGRAYAVYRRSKRFPKKTSAWYTEIQYQLDVYDAYLAWLRTSRYNDSEDIGWALSVGHKQATMER